MSTAPPPTPPPARGRTSVKILLALALVVVLVVGLGAAFLLSRGSGGGDEQAGGAAAPTASPSPSPEDHARPDAALAPGDGLVVNTSPARAGAPRIDVYLDPQCPWCKRFHEVLAPGFDELLAGGDARVVVHPRSFLDDNFGNDSSARAAQAMACASDAGRLWPYIGALYDGQPVEEGEGYTGDQLRRFATQAGITGAAATTWQRCVSNFTYADYVADVERASVRDNVNGTPVYRVDGRDVRLDDVMPEGGARNPDAFFDQVPGR